MASGIFAILDDIAALMDDVAVASKVATKKTAGILGDDLAVNADKATGFVSSREIPVLWAITKGSLLNKLIIVPIALLLNYFLPVAIKVILVLGGLYLAFEGVEKIIHYFFHKEEEKEEAQPQELLNNSAEEEEKNKIKAAITTDFILSVEIVIIALGSVLDKPLFTQIATVCLVALIATFGVYGIVALIVRMDDLGYLMITKSNNKGIIAAIGKGLVKLLPIIIRTLAVVGTLALIMVAGGIFAHEIPYLHHLVETYPSVTSLVFEIIFGIVGGLLMVPLFVGFQKVFQKKK